MGRALASSLEGNNCRLVAISTDSVEEVARVVAACRECDTSGAWSHQPKGTSATWQPGDALTSDISKSKMSAKDEKTEVKKKKKEEVVSAMDDVQPGDSISNIDSFNIFSRRW